MAYSGSRALLALATVPRGAAVVDSASVITALYCRACRES